MKLFVTGGTGFIGSAVVKKLIEHGHEVTGLSRSTHGDQVLADLGATSLRGTLDDLTTLAEAAKQADGVLHLGYNNDFNHYDEAVAQDLAAVKAMLAALTGSNKPFVNTSGTLMVTDLGRAATEQDTAPLTGRAVSESLARQAAQAGVRGMAVRLSPTVHDEHRQGFGTLLAGLAVQHGQAAYVGDGMTRWPSVHRLDATDLFVAALEHGEAGAVYNAAAETGITVKAIATTIGQALKLPVTAVTPADAEAYFGWFTNGIQQDNPTSSDWTQNALNWHPTHPGLLADLATFLNNPENVAQLTAH